MVSWDYGLGFGRIVTLRSLVEGWAVPSYAPLNSLLLRCDISRPFSSSHRTSCLEVGCSRGARAGLRAVRTVPRRCPRCASRGEGGGRLTASRREATLEDREGSRVGELVRDVSTAQHCVANRRGAGGMAESGGWKQNVVGHAEVDPRTLVGHPQNPKVHPAEQD